MTYPPVSASSTSSWRITSSVSPSMVGSFFEATRVPTTRPSSTGRPGSLLGRGLIGAAKGENHVDVDVRAGDHVRGDDLADLLRAADAGVDRGLHRGDVTAHDGRHVAAARLLVRDELHLRRLDHRVGRLDHCRKPAALDHSQCFSHEFLLSLLSDSPSDQPASLPSSPSGAAPAALQPTSMSRSSPPR